MTDAQAVTLALLRQSGYIVRTFEMPRSNNLVCVADKRLSQGEMILRIYPDGRYVDPFKLSDEPTKMEKTLWLTTLS